MENLNPWINIDANKHVCFIHNWTSNDLQPDNDDDDVNGISHAKVHVELY